MARASTRTLLPLDRWASYLGIEPRHFNQVVSELTPVADCKQAWNQYSWQASDRVGREEVAQAIHQAERDIIPALGYFPIPVWIAGEIKRTPSSWDVKGIGHPSLATPAARYVGLETTFGHVISGGIETRELLGTPTITWQDLDADTYFETAQVVQATTVTDTNEIRVYFASHNGEDEWEIRPLRNVSISGGNVTILIDRHLLVNPDLWEALQPAAVDGDVDGNFVTQVEVYRVYNDPSQQAQLQWERLPSSCQCGDTSCAMCAWQTQWACLQTRDPRRGLVTYQPGTWDSTDEEFDAAQLAINRRPERVRLWYRAGFQSTRVARPMVEMDPELEFLIVIHSLCLLDRPICSCSNVEAFHQRWTEDKALVAAKGIRYQVTEQDLSCPWGTKIGSMEAWKRINHSEGMALGRIAHY